ncbi:peptidylprolyl isomerase [Pseudogemmobacter sonorensis]|uniref:peptidylprolyl isomerase n=1 Tax=Pseudogemmobacter sonorensis TaxID=2989681 RepID=UPI0036BC54B3
MAKAREAKAGSDDGGERKKPARGKQAATWGVTALLILGLGGFGASSFGTTVSTIGTVGDTRITTREYSRALYQQSSAITQQFGMAFGVQDLLALGLGEQVLSELVSQAALDNEAWSVGVSVGDATVATEVMRSSSFTGATGGFDRTGYRQSLQQNGWTEAEFEASVRRDISRSLLSASVAGGTRAPAALVDALYRFEAERRGFSLLRLGPGDLAELPAPADEAALRAYYDANPEAFTRPESKRIQYAMLLPAMLAGDQPVDEPALEQLYQDRIAEFVVAERRLVERLVYPDEAARDAALAAHQAGTGFEALVEARGLTMIAVDMGDVSEPELGAAGAAVFAAAEGTVVAAETPLGPALFRVNGTLPGEEVSFEEARAQLAEEIQAEAARREIAARVDEIDDLLAGGESLDSLAGLMGMEYGTLDYAAALQGDHVLEGYSAFRQAAEAVAEGDFAEAVLLDDGGVVAIEYVETLPPAPIPFDEAREAVNDALEGARLAEALATRAEAIKAAVEGGASLSTQGMVEVTREIARSGAIANAPATLIGDIFAMEPGDLRVIVSGDFVAVLRLDQIHAAAETGEAADAARDDLARNLETALARDALTAFTDASARAAGISIDQNAINLVNASLQ